MHNVFSNCQVQIWFYYWPKKLSRTLWRLLFATINGRVTFEIGATLTATKCTKRTQIKIYVCFDDDKLHGDLDGYKLSYELNRHKFHLTLYIYHFIFLMFLHFSVISSFLKKNTLSLPLFSLLLLYHFLYSCYLIFLSTFPLLLYFHLSLYVLFITILSYFFLGLIALLSP